MIPPRAKAESSGNGTLEVTAENTYDQAIGHADDPVLTLSALTEVFDSTIEQED